ncbi:MAG: zinc-ribbon domain-containing protein [Pirellulaceae bacterium]
MIIFGTTTINTTRGTGDFSCPRCSIRRQYRHKAANRFFTLYFIPLIPMGTAGTWIECTSCGGTYAEEVLYYNADAEKQELINQIRRVLVLAMLDAGATEAANIAALRDVCRDSLDVMVTDQQIYEDVRLAQEADAHLVPFVQYNLGEVNARGKQLLLTLTVKVLVADRRFDERKRQVVRQLGAALQVPVQITEETISDSGPDRIGY